VINICGLTGEKMPQPITSHQKKLRGFGNSQTYCYLQTLLTGDTETGRKSRIFFMAEPLAVI
jgi:hypothetical protein